MAGTGLKCLTIVHQCFNGISRFCTCKFFLICLLTLDYRNCQVVFTEISIYIQHLNGSFFCFFCCCMCSMTFLPQEFCRTKERSCGFFPSYNGTPLIVQLGQISVGLDNFGIEITEQGFRSRTYTKSFFQLVHTTMCYPCNFRSKTFYVVFFLLKQTLGNKHGHVYIFHTSCLKHCIQVLLNIFPDCITIGT